MNMTNGATVDDGSSEAITPLNNTKVDNNMAQYELITVERGIRGKGNKDKKVSFQEIAEGARPDNAMEAMVVLVENDNQKLWDTFVRGFNELAYEAVADPIAEYIDASWTDEVKKSFRVSVNALSKTLSMDKEEVATFLVAKMASGKE